MQPEVFPSVKANTANPPSTRLAREGFGGSRAGTLRGEALSRLACGVVCWLNERRSAALKIAQISPLAEALPPRLYGGIERIVSYLTEELVRQGHDVTVFATGDSRIRAELVPSSPQALRLDPSV